uniref:DUF4219 domain-containing protein/UBN2 domain-containing protein n=1 Tax=Tanacetum cinerariifolium TaxID=118510 RepID=A0A699H751_TANCI|nr:DUF4219 domain-containing protein/UBN2 domain-containing protein [Tanacetum cinerariifolium]
MMYIETPYEKLKDTEKRQLGKNNEAKLTIYNALPLKEYERVSMCKTAKEFAVSDEETIDSGFTRFIAIVTSLISLDKDYSNTNNVRKFLQVIPLRWRSKVTTIEEAKELAKLPLEELIGNLKVYEMVLRNDGVISMSTKEKVKSLALKAKVTRGQTSNESVCQDGSDEDEDEEEDFNSIVKNLWKSKGVRSSRRERNYYGYGNKNHFVDDCQKVKEKKAFIGVAWSDSDNGDQIKKYATCLMAIGSEKIKDPETMMYIETPYEKLKDNKKRQLGKYNEAKLTLYNALPCKEYEQVFMCKTAKKVWHTLIVTHQGNSQVKDYKIDLLTQQYKKFLISDEETIDSTWFIVIVTSLISLDKDYSNNNHVQMFLRSLPLRWWPKVTAIEEAKDLAKLPLDEIIGNLKVHEMVLRNDGVISKSTKEKVKSLALKAKVTMGQTSNDSVCQDGSNEDDEEEEEFNSIMKNLWTLFKKSNMFERENGFGNGGDRTKELFTPFENLERVFRSKIRLFETPGLVESSSLEFGLFFDIEERSEEEAIEIITETMEQYMSNTRRNYSDSIHEDAKEHIEKVLEIIDLFYIPEIGQMSKVLQERGFESLPSSTETNPRDHVKSISTTKADLNEIRHIGASVSVMPFSTYTNLGLGDLAHTRLTIELANKTIKHPRGIAENVLVRIGKFIFPVDFIILDIPKDDDVPLILGRPFLSTTHAKIDVFKRKFTPRVGEYKIVFKSIKLATSIIRRVYMLKEGTNLDSKTKLIGEAINESFDPHYGSYIELNDLDVPLEPRMDQDSNFEPTLDENIIVNEPTFKSCYKMNFSCMIGYKHGIADFPLTFPLI